jgi:hypothetical protein
MSTLHAIKLDGEVVHTDGYVSTGAFSLNGHEATAATRRLLYVTLSVPRSKHFHLGYINQSVYGVSGTSRCSFIHLFIFRRSFTRYGNSNLYNNTKIKTNKQRATYRIYKYIIYVCSEINRKHINTVVRTIEC